MLDGHELEPHALSRELVSTEVLSAHELERQSLQDAVVSGMRAAENVIANQQAELAGRVQRFNRYGMLTDAISEATDSAISPRAEEARLVLESMSPEELRAYRSIPEAKRTDEFALAYEDTDVGAEMSKKVDTEAKRKSVFGPISELTGEQV